MKLLYLKPHFIDFTVCIKLLETLRVPTARKIYLFFEKTIFLPVSLTMELFVGATYYHSQKFYHNSMSLR